MSESTQQVSKERAAIERLRSVFDGKHPTAHWSRGHAAELFSIIERLQQSLTLTRSNIEGVLDVLGADALRVREGGGQEDILASLALSIAKLQKRACNAPPRPAGERSAEKVLDALFEECTVQLWPDFSRGPTINHPIEHNLAKDRNERRRIEAELRMRMRVEQVPALEEESPSR